MAIIRRVYIRLVGTLFLSMRCPFTQPVLPLGVCKDAKCSTHKRHKCNPKAVSKRRVQSTRLSPIPIKVGPDYLTVLRSNLPHLPAV